MPPPSAKNPVVTEGALRHVPDPARAGVRPAAQAKVASCVMFVAELDRSIDFYSDVLACEVSVRDSEAALLMAHGGFQIYLVAKGPRNAHPSPAQRRRTALDPRLYA